MADDRKPLLLFFAGPNGSGKSTLTRMVGVQGVYTNADDVVSSTGMSYQEAAKFVEKHVTILFVKARTFRSRRYFPRTFP